MVPILHIASEWSLPVYNFEGTVTSVQVLHGDSRYYSAYLTIATAQGSSICVHASGRSPGWVLGQRLKVHYYGVTGELIQALLIGPDGRQQGFFQRTGRMGDWGAMLMGVLFLWMIWKIYRRDLNTVGSLTTAISPKRKLPRSIGDLGSFCNHLT